MAFMGYSSPGAQNAGLGNVAWQSPEEGAAANAALGQYTLARDKAKWDAGLAAQQNAAEMNRAQIAANAQMFPEQNKMARFNQIFPLLQNQFSSLNNPSAFAPGGNPFPATSISTQNPWSVGQTQQAVNASRAFNDKSTGNQLRSMQEGLGARGYGPNSALSNALGNQIQMGSLANNLNQGRSIRENAAQQNVGQRFKTDTLREQQRAAQEEADIKRRTPVLGSQSQLLSALAGLI